jgi:transcription elongation GreA/GreB family factor
MNEMKKEEYERVVREVNRLRKLVKESANKVYKVQVEGRIRELSSRIKAAHKARYERER